MKIHKNMDTSLGEISITIEIETRSGRLVYIGKVVGFENFFCYSDDEETCEKTLALTMEVYLDIWLKEDLSELDIKFSDEEDR